MSQATAGASETSAPIPEKFAKVAELALDPASATHEPDSPLLWHDATSLPLEGIGFADPVTTYSRLPARAEGKVTSWVWGLARDTAGICVRFVTDSATIGAVWDGGVTNYSHVSSVGSAGIEIYAREDNDTTISTDEGPMPAPSWKFAGLGYPRPERTLCVLTSSRPRKLQEYRLYLPLFHVVTQLRIGVEKGAILAPAPPRPAESRKPVVYYGTSITHGGCASRPGMCHVALLGRWLDRPMINLGFSGSGKSEPEMAEFVAEVDGAAYVIEPLPNMSQEQVEERIAPFLRILRKRRPNAPIIVSEHILQPSSHPMNVALRKAVDGFRAENGPAPLILMPGEAQLAGNENATVDGVHPSDLGFLRIARKYFPVLRKLLGEAPKP